MLRRRHLLLLPACVPAVARAATPSPVVVASFSILADLARAAAGGRARVEALIGPDRDPHAWRPKPSDLRLLARADVLVLNGLGLEGWARRLVAASGFSGRVVIASSGVVPIRAAGGGVDPHAWQDVANARRYVGNIARALGDPGRAAAYEARLDRLDHTIRAALAAIPAARRRVITTHDSLAYFGRAYGLALLSPLGLSPDSEPSARAVARLERQIAAEHITALFFENMSNRSLLAQIARDTGVRVGGVLYTDALSGPDGPAPDYIAMMRHNLGMILRALA